VETYVNPYKGFIDVLAHPRAGAHRLALTGELIAAYAEMSYLLACTKGSLVPQVVWLDCARELERGISTYRDAWRRFATEISPIVEGHDFDATVSPLIGPETTQAFQEAVDRVRGALDLMRREAPSVGVESFRIVPAVPGCFHGTRFGSPQ
jgi:hypothetical protein